MQDEDQLDLVSTERRNPTTEDLDAQSSLEIVELIHAEDRKVARAVYAAREQIAQAIDWASSSLKSGGRLIYAGAGTSGRLGVLDAAECPPTFGTRPDQVVALMAGGSAAITQAVEGAEDNFEAGQRDVAALHPSEKDTVVGISSGSTTRYVRGVLSAAKTHQAKTVLLTCAPLQDRGEDIDLHIAAITGQEVLPGSTRMKAGTATKMILNMISTGAMVRSGRSFGNLMVDVSCSNAKLVQRGLRIIEEATGVDRPAAESLLKDSGGHIKTAIVMARRHCSREDARKVLNAHQGFLRNTLKTPHTPNPLIKAVLFDMDGTLLRYNLPNGFSAWAALGHAYALEEAQEDWIDQWKQGLMPYEWIWESCARALEGKSILPAKRVFFPNGKHPPYSRGFLDTMKLITPHYQTGIVSSGLTLVSQRIVKQFEMQMHLANSLGVTRGVFNGTYRLRVPLLHKAEAFEALVRAYHLNPHEVCYVGDSEQDLGVFKQVGLPVLIHNRDPKLVDACRGNVIPDLLALPPLIERHR